MIGIRDNLTLSVTKLRGRRIRLIITTVVSGLLFTILIVASLVVRGTLSSIQSYSSEGFVNRFLVSVTTSPDPNLLSSQSYISRAKQIQASNLASEKAEARRRGIAFDSANLPDVTKEGGVAGSKQITLNTDNPAAVQAITELTPLDSNRQQVINSLKGYDAAALYESDNLNPSLASDFVGTPVVGGAEVKPDTSNGLTVDSLASYAQNTQAVDGKLMLPFVFDGVDITPAPGRAIPILAPIDAAEKLLSLAPLPVRASAKQKLDRLKLLRSEARNKEFDVCYRNDAAVQLRTAAKQQTDGAAAGAAKSSYVAPPVTYQEPSAPCSAVTIKSDLRTSAERANDVKLEQLNADFGFAKAQTHLVAFRIVGVIPQLNSPTQAASPSAIVSSFLTSTIGYGWFMSREAAEQNPILNQMLVSPVRKLSGTQNFVAEFPDRTRQKRYLDERTCQPNYDSAPAADTSQPDDPTAACRKHLQFFLASYGNPLAALYDAKPIFDKVLEWTVIIIAALSGIIMMGTVGKIIADGRKETSVFRAVGAKRLDIAQIYLLYAAILATAAFVLAFVAALLIAVIIEISYSGGLSVQAVIAFNARDTSRAFHLIGLNLGDLLRIYAFVIATGLISAIIPLLTNLKRNPITDMREE